MSLFDGLKQTFNIGGTTIIISTEKKHYSHSDIIKGHVILKGGDYEQKGEGVTLELQEFWTETRSMGGSPPTTTTVTVSKAHESRELSSSFLIHPKEDQKFSFEVRLPRNARISNRSSGWRIGVHIEIHGAIDPQEYLVLEVDPTEEFLSILESCEVGMRFHEQKEYRRWNPQNERTFFRLLPPKVLKGELDYLRLELCLREDGAVEGEAVFDLQEKSVMDYFKAVFNQDQVRKPLLFQPKQIFLEEHLPNQAEIVNELTKMLKEVVEAHQ